MKCIIAIALFVAGCKQGLGDRCQVTDDCSPPLICNQGSMKCDKTQTGGIDATVPDGAPVDARIDAPDDAKPPNDAVPSG